MDFSQILSIAKDADNIKMAAIGLAATVILEIISRKIPNELIYKYVSKWGIVLDGFIRLAAFAVSKFLLKWLPKAIANKAEEGLITTLCTLVAALIKPIADAPYNFVKYLTEDNKMEKLK